MKKKRIIAFLCVAVMALSMMAGCQKKQEDTKETTVTQEAKEDKITIEVAALKGPTAMGMVSMMDQSEQNKTANTYHMTIAGAADEITAGILKGEYPIASIPCNLASVLYQQSKGKIKVAAINTLGVLYIVETQDTIHSIEDLKGKTIYSTGKGTTPEYTLNYLLSSHGIDPKKDVTIEFKSEAAEVAAILSESKDAIAMLPQPYVTTAMMKNDKIRIALDIEKEWEAVSEGSSVVTGVTVVNTEFLEKNKEAVDAFLEEYKTSVDLANQDTESVSALIEKYDIIKQPVAQKALPFCSITLITGNDMKTKISAYLQTLYDQNPKAVGGNMPDDNFYYIP